MTPEAEALRARIVERLTEAHAEGVGWLSTQEIAAAADVAYTKAYPALAALARLGTLQHWPSNSPRPWMRGFRVDKGSFYDSDFIEIRFRQLYGTSVRTSNKAHWRIMPEFPLAPVGDVEAFERWLVL